MRYPWTQATPPDLEAWMAARSDPKFKPRRVKFPSFARRKYTRGQLYRDPKRGVFFYT